MYKIAVIGGDGTGPEVIAEGIKVINASCSKHSKKIEFINYDIG